MPQQLSAACATQLSARSVGRRNVYLSRYTISKPSVVVELDPETGQVLRDFQQPEDWVWDPNRSHAHWETYRGNRFFVYFNDSQLVFQTPSARFVLDGSYSCELTRFLGLWMRFKLLKDGTAVYRFTYRDPQTRFWSLLSAAANMDDWWDWDNPFDFVHSYLGKRRLAAQQADEPDVE